RDHRRALPRRRSRGPRARAPRGRRLARGDVMRVSFSLGLTGGYTTDTGARPLALALEAEVPLRRGRDGGVTGARTGGVAAAAIAERAPAQGAVTLGRALRDDLAFLGDDGAAWRLTAEQRLATGGTPSAFT